MTVRYTKRAVREINNIADYFTTVNPDAGAEILAKIEHVVNTLPAFPNVGGSLNGKPNVRYLNVNQTNYRIYYRTRSNWIEVISIFDTRRNPSHAPKA